MTSLFVSRMRFFLLTISTFFQIRQTSIFYCNFAFDGLKIGQHRTKSTLGVAQRGAIRPQQKRTSSAVKEKNTRKISRWRQQNLSSVKKSVYYLIIAILLTSFQSINVRNDKIDVKHLEIGIEITVVLRNLPKSTG